MRRDKISVVPIDASGNTATAEKYAFTTLSDCLTNPTSRLIHHIDARQES